MTHPLVLALFDDEASVVRAGRQLRDLGIPRERVSIVARSHGEEAALADVSGASPGTEIEDSRSASRLGELSAHLIAAAALVMPGIGPIVADGPLSADFGEAAGHVAGGLARTLERTGLANADAREWEQRIKAGAFLLGAHVEPGHATAAREVFEQCGATTVTEGTWRD